MKSNTIIDAYLFLKSRREALDAKKTKAPPVPLFLEWCERVSPQYNFRYRWIRYVEEEQSKNAATFFSIPPQHGKTTAFTIHKAAYLLKHFPTQRGIIISYNVDVTARFQREILALLDKEMVPLYSRSQKEIVHSNLTGSISFCGFSGGITSKPAEWIIVDDPVRNMSDACSDRHQELLISGFVTAIVPRLQERFKLWVTQTRWHEKDLIGQVIQLVNEKGIDFPYSYINLPAICESEGDPLGRAIGEVLCPERFSEETIRMKMLLAQADGYALYQGRPCPPDGLIFTKSDFEGQEVNNLRDIPTKSLTILSVDSSFKETKDGSYVAVGVYKYDTTPGILYKLDQVNKRMDFSDTLVVLRRLIQLHRCSYCLVEAKANGEAIMSVLRKEFPGFVAIEPEGGKISRAYAAQPFIRTKRFKVYSGMANYSSFMEQLLSFPRGANDDMVDETTQAINYISEKYGFYDIGKEIEGYKSLLNRG